LYTCYTQKTLKHERNVNEASTSVMDAIYV